MSTTREGPNPLRPYYKPPSIGIPQDLPGAISNGTHGLGPRNGSAASYASSARDILSDIDYTDYGSPSTVESVKKQIDDWVYRYMSILLAQPFDVAKTILQIRSQVVDDGTAELKSPRQSYRESAYSDYPSDDSDPDEPAYFTSTAPSSHSYSPSRSRRRHDSGSGILPPPNVTPPAKVQLLLKRSDAVLEVISQEWSKEGAWGVWKASNATFVYGFLLQTLEKWSRGLISALLNVPDPEISAGLIGSTYPWASLAVAVAAAASAGIILAPLDLIRTKLIVTPVSTPKRSLTTQLRALPSYLCPASILLPTLLHSLVTPAISHSTPLLLRSHLSIDPILTPNTYQIAKFFSRTAELFIKLPLETVLRRGQVAVLKEDVEIARAQGTWVSDLETLVPIGEYRGVVGTMWMIAREEGVREPPLPKKKAKPQKGQGLPGLWRGWRVGMWGLVGMWTSRALSGGNGGEF
ncbi:mitochondrial fusion protein-like protein [Leptodontidium sp. MPI-SDFR-AT-0119]|nr:mitochondrial fusion protein-like protein [Leptodontidium sp. MPI-SDFR-AT-0119]